MTIKNLPKDHKDYIVAEVDIRETLRTNITTYKYFASYSDPVYADSMAILINGEVFFKNNKGGFSILEDPMLQQEIDEIDMMIG